MKKLLLVFLFLNFATYAQAQSSFTAKDASGVTQTFKSFNCSANICSVSVPTDITGAAFGVTANPFFVTNNGTFAVQATQAGTWNIGSITTLPAITGTITANQGGTWNIGSITTLPAITGTVTANAGTNLNTSALALESGGNLASLVTQLGAVTASPVANTVNDRLKSINTTLGSPFQAGGSIGNTSFGISGSLPAFASTPTFNLGTLNGAATAANQTNASQKTQIVDGSGNVIGSTSNALNVAITSGGGSGGTSSNFAAAFPATGTAVGMSQGGNMVALSGTSGNLNVQCANCSGSGVSTADQATFTAGTSLFAGTGGFFQTTATSNPLTNGQQGMWQMTANRAGFVNLRNASGTEIGTASNNVIVGQATAANLNATVVGTGTFATQSTLAAETTKVIGTTRTLGNGGAVVDFAGQNAASPANSWLIGGQFNTTPTTITSGNSSPLQLDNAGNLLVNIKAGASSGAVAQGSTTSGQTGGLNQAAVTTSAPTYTNATTNPLSMDTSGNLRVAVSSAVGLAQGSTTSGQTGSMIMGAVTTSAPTYTTAQTAYASLDTSGSLRVNCMTGCAAGTLSNATSGVATSSTNSGAVGYNYGFNGTTWDQLQVDASKNLKVLAVGAGTAGSASGGVVTVQGVASMTPFLTNPGTAASWGIQTQGSTTSGQSGSLNLAAVSTSAPTYTNAQTSAMSLTTSGALRTDNSSVAGTTMLTGNGASGAGSIRVTLANDSSAIAVKGEGATGSTAPTGAQLQGVQSGANMVAMLQASASTAINVSTATTTQLVALSGSTKIYVTSFDVIAGGTGNITFVYGTGTNCGTGQTALTGAYNLTAQAGIAKGSGIGPVLVVPSGNALCVLTSAAVQMSGSVSYTQF